MTALEDDFTKPDFANPVDADLDAVRDNFEWLMVCAASSAYMLPGWTTVAVSTTSPLVPEEPNTITMTHADGRKMRFTLTWSGGLVTLIVFEFDRDLGGGYETMTLGTITPSYDGSNNFTGATVA